jgi:flagellar basal body-associated protein FliL
MVKKGNGMNTTLITNQRLIAILLVLLIILAVLLILGIVAGFLMMGGGMTLAPGASAGVNSGMMKDMMTACTNMMQNFQNP